ncbi:MAG: DUF5011 domain-containing protein [Oscillospiraceae bacterium]|nr:DUF5011 domain-containing protein [Oscillospiraceae bacterium]
MKKHRIIWFFLALLCLTLTITLFQYHDRRNPKFRDLTVELGTGVLTANDFKTKNAWSSDIAFISDVSAIDLGCTGETQLKLRHGTQEETVTLTVADTTPPTADVEAFRQIPITGFPEASELVSNIQDASAVTVFYREEPRVPLDYGDIPVTVVVEDVFGNRVEKVCVFSFRWMPETVTVELGEEISDDMVLYNPVRDASFLDPMEMKRIRAAGTGEFTITTACSGKSQECLLIVQDTMGPDLSLRDVQIRPGKQAKLSDFAVKAKDPSGVADIRLMTKLGRKSKGSYPVVVEAEDNLGNITRKEATLYVATDFQSPRISGDMTDLVVKKNEALPDLLKGIKAKDNKDGSVPVECDVSGVDVKAGGTYHAVYRATDSAGNVATRKRKIIVEHDQEDTDRLAREIAATFQDDDIDGMRRYVYYGIGYNSDWGGDDPVWHGFTEKRGNCYVHVLCMKSLLDAKGITNQMIWTTDKTHYWLIVKINNAWKHIEPTPSVFPMPVFMNDAERLATLSGREWDTTQWPSCK